MSLMARWVLTYRGRGGRSATRPEVHVRSGRGTKCRLVVAGGQIEKCRLDGLALRGGRATRLGRRVGVASMREGPPPRPVPDYPAQSDGTRRRVSHPRTRRGCTPLRESRCLAGLGHDRTASGRTVSGWLCRLSVQPRRGVGVGSRNADGCLCRGRADRTTRPAAPKTATARAPVSLVTPTYRTPPERPSLARCDGRPGPDPRGRPSPADLIVSPTPDCAFTKVASRRPARCHSAPVRPACMTTARGRGWIGHHFAGTGRVTFGPGRSRVLETLQSVGDL